MSQLPQPHQPLPSPEPHQGGSIALSGDGGNEDAAEQERPRKRTKVEEVEVAEEASNLLSFCEICTETKEQDQILRMDSCSHAPYCSDCISRHVSTKVDDGFAAVACPGEGCRTAIELESCRDVVPKRVIEQWEELLCRELIGKGGVYYCPFKDCSAMMVVEGEVLKESECPHCHRLFCAECRVGWHSGFDCLGFKEKEEDVIVIEMAKSNKWGRCPRCRFYVERIEGCPRITCRCKYEFCYGCGAEWSRFHGGCTRD